MSNEMVVINKELFHGKVKASKVGLVIPEGTNFEEWDDIGSVINSVGWSIHWWIGDWVRFGDKKEWGKKYTDAIEKFGFAYQTLRIDVYVCESIDLFRRRNKLSFGHHAEVAKLEAKEQDKWLDKAENNDWSIIELRNFIKENERKDKYNEKPKLPEGTFDVIYADPPWQYSNSGFEMSAENQYPTMDTDSICNMPIPNTPDNAILFLWVTNPLLEDGLRVCNAWGFEYKTNFVWIKERHTAGFYVFGQHELLLICTKGSMLPYGEKYKSIIRGNNDEHSKKPELVYEMIETMYPNLKYVELFARQRRKGWGSYGNEI